jgi:hypothetical protein
MNNTSTYFRIASKVLMRSLCALVWPFWVSTAVAVGNSFYWDNTSGNGRWSTSTNWVGNSLPGNNDDIFFETDYGTGAEIVDLRSNRIVRSINFDNPYAYTLENNRIDFQAVTGTIGINVTEFNGIPASAITHTIDSDIRFNTELTITHMATNVTLTFNQDLNGLNSGNLTLEGGGSVFLDTGARITNVPSVNINEGTLSLGRNNRIDNDVSFNLGGGTLDTNGFDDRVDTLTLSASSTIDMGSGSSTLEFSDSSSATWAPGAVLTITNWTGSLTGAGADRLIFRNSSTALTAAQISQIRFLNPAGLGAGIYKARILTNGEIVPVPVPEPSTIIIGSLLLLVGLGDVYRRYQKGKTLQSEEKNA